MKWYSWIALAWICSIALRTDQVEDLWDQVDLRKFFYQGWDFASGDCGTAWNLGEKAFHFLADCLAEEDPNDSSPRKARLGSFAGRAPGSSPIQRLLEANLDKLSEAEAMLNGAENSLNRHGSPSRRALAQVGDLVAKTRRADDRITELAMKEGRLDPSRERALQRYLASRERLELAVTVASSSGNLSKREMFRRIDECREGIAARRLLIRKLMADADREISALEKKAHPLEHRAREFSQTRDLNPKQVTTT